MYEYQCIKELGKGSYGTIYLLQNKYTLEYDVVKIIEKKESTNNLNEIYNHALLGKHENIVEFKKVYQTTHHIFIIMEYVDGIDLFDAIKAEKNIFSEEKARYYLKHIVSGVQHCHDRGVCHNDLKLENVLVAKTGVKICDFGFSASYYYALDPVRIVGSLGYFAPELINKKLDSDGTKVNIYSDNTKVDIWCIGVMLFVMLCGHYPFEEKNEPKNITKHLRNILKCKYELPDHLSADSIDLIKKILVANPGERPSLQEILSHKWFMI